jgi:peptidoglycan/LPS O-acetylase OafA/YrhL
LKKIKSIIFSEIEYVPQFLQISYFPSLDGLRALSIFIVISSHIINVRLNYSNTIIDGALGVQIFFVISGFLITTLLLKEKVKSGKISIKKFYIRRALRIFPVAYLFILIVFILDRLFQLKISTSDYLSALFYYKNYISTAWELNHFWSLSVEEQFYIFFPFLLSNLNLKNYIILCLSLLFLAPIFNFFAYHENAAQSVFYYFSRLFSYNSIVFGSLLSILSFKFSFHFLKNRIFDSVIVIVLIFFTYFINPLFIGDYLRLILISILLLRNVLFPNDYFGKLLNFHIIKMIGLYSYSLYIWQQIFTVNIPWHGLTSYSNSILLNTFALFLVAYLSYSYFEKPFLLLKKRFI